MLQLIAINPVRPVRTQPENRKVQKYFDDDISTWTMIYILLRDFRGTYIKIARI